MKKFSDYLEVNKGAINETFDWEKFDDTDISGPSLENQFDSLLSDIKELMKKEIKDGVDQKTFKREVYKLYRQKLDSWLKEN